MQHASSPTSAPTSVHSSQRAPREKHRASESTGCVTALSGLLLRFHRAQEGTWRRQGAGSTLQAPTARVCLGQAEPEAWALGLPPPGCATLPRQGKGFGTNCTSCPLPKLPIPPHRIARSPRHADGHTTEPPLRPAVENPESFQITFPSKRRTSNKQFYVRHDIKLQIGYYKVQSVLFSIKKQGKAPRLLLRSHSRCPF